MADMSRADDPPPRPPAPKLSHVQHKGRQHSAGSIGIHFSPASVDDSWEDESLVNDDHSKSKPINFRLGLDADELLLSEAILRDNYSKSAPASEVTTPESWLSPAAGQWLAKDKEETDLSPTTALSVTNKMRAAQNQPPLPPPPSAVVYPNKGLNQPTESFISGIFRERIQDPLSAFIGKIEVLSVEKGILSQDSKLLRRGDGQDLKSVSPSNSKSDLSVKEGVEKSKKFSSESFSKTNDGSLSAKSSSQSLSAHDNEGGSQVKIMNGDGGLEDPSTEPLLKVRAASFDINDLSGDPAMELLSPEAQGAFPKSCSLDMISHQAQAPQTGSESPKKIKATFQKLVQPIANKAASVTSKSTSSSRTNIPMSLSGLLLNSHAEADDNSNSESDMFFDPQEEPSAFKKTQSSVSAPPDSNINRQEHADVKVSEETEIAEKPKPKSGIISKQKLLSVFIVVLAYLVIPLPTYLAGMVFGAFIAATAIFTYLWWTTPLKPMEIFAFPDLATLPPIEVPEMKDSRNDEEKFKGWMNELSNYDPGTYSINHTHSVLVHLEGTKLRLQTPKHNITKRAMWDEPNHHTYNFIKQRHFDVVGARVLLLPPGLIKKRLWSKKYPICLLIPTRGQDSPLRPTSPSSEKTKEHKIYLFARSARAKEDWFRRFHAAACNLPLPTQIAKVLGSNDVTKTHRRMSSSSSLENFNVRHRRQGSADSNISDPGRDSPGAVPMVPIDSTHEKRLRDYLRYMARVIPAESQQRLQDQMMSDARRRSINSSFLPSPVTCEPQVAWVNSLITRCFWDFLREKFWVEKIQTKIQKKLSKIHVPYFIDNLTVTGIELGNEVPIIRRSSKPYIDDRGLWFDLDIAYTGGFQLSLETKCNLMKLTSKTTEEKKHGAVKPSERSAITDSDEEDSAESSTDEEGGEENVDAPTEDRTTQAQGGGASKKILRIVDKIAQSKYFHKATEYKYVKKAMEGVSNTRLLLVVEVKNIAGPLAINIPPPPTDRLWYGFRKNPRLWLSAKPWVGEREVSLSHITDWIERKLAVEFQRVFVMPNMDDVPIPIMCDHLPSKATDPEEQ